MGPRSAVPPKANSNSSPFEGAEGELRALAEIVSLRKGASEVLQAENPPTVEEIQNDGA